MLLPNKNEIRKSVEGIYGVNVLSVNIVRIPAKKRRLGKTEGFRKAYKKAIWEMWSADNHDGEPTEEQLIHALFKDLDDI